MQVNVCRMAFEGKLLKRGFWLYVWEVKGDRTRHLYVGRTGDSSSANASSPFRRIGQHLDPSLNAKGNALGRRLKEAGLDAELCTFEMIAIGPLFDEQKTFSAHSPLRDKTAALERALVDELRSRGYEVLGVHPRASTPDSSLMEQVTAVLDKSFPNLQSPVASDKPRFQPIRLRGEGPSASEIVIAERGRFQILHFIDTSAFLKLLVYEVGSDRMLQFWLGEDDRNKVVSAISQIEARSGICRLRKERRMTSDEATIAFDSIYAEMRRLIGQPLTPPVIEAANGLVDRYNLRALDAIQLGSAVIARELLRQQEMRFASSDQSLLEAAQTEGFTSWNPNVST